MESSGLICNYGVNLMHPHLFKKKLKPIASLVNVQNYTNTLDVSFKWAPWRKHKHDINVFWDKFSFFEKKQTRSLICSKSYEMTNFLAILELCAFYLEYKKVKFMAINRKFDDEIVKPMLNILCKHSFCDFVKIQQKFPPFPCWK